MKTMHKAVVENHELPALLLQWTDECLLDLERQHMVDFDNPRFNWARKRESDINDLLEQALIHHDPLAEYDPLDEEEDLETRVAHLVADVIETFPEVKRICVASGSVDTLVIYSEEL